MQSLNHHFKHLNINLIIFLDDISITDVKRVKVFSYIFKQKCGYTPLGVHFPTPLNILLEKCLHPSVTPP